MARALYARTPVLLLDDIFSSLDLTTADMMFHRLFGKDGLIRKWNPTVILTTHSSKYNTNQTALFASNETRGVLPFCRPRPVD